MADLVARIAGEAANWSEAAIRSCPGGIGVHLRRLWYRRRLEGAVDSFFGVGCHILGGKRITIGRRLCMEAGGILQTFEGSIVIGDDVFLNYGVIVIADHGHVSIGNDVSIGPRTIICPANHRFDQTPSIPIRLQGHVPDGIEIGNDVWLGSAVTVLPGARIGNHCVIGAGSIVRGEIPPGTLAVGNPARVIRSLFLNKVDP